MKRFAMGYLGVAATALLMSHGAAAATPFRTCTDAENYSYNVAGYLTASAYTKIACDSSQVDQYDMMLRLVIPPYVNNLASLDPNTANCVFKGAYDGWISMLDDQYDKCPSFGPLSRTKMGSIAAALLVQLVDVDGAATTPAVVERVFAYDKSRLSLGTDVDLCASVIRGQLRGTSVAMDLEHALINTVCP